MFVEKSLGVDVIKVKNLKKKQRAKKGRNKEESSDSSLWYNIYITNIWLKFLYVQ